MSSSTTAAVTDESAATTAAPTQTAPMLNIPAELRNKIYLLTLVGKVPIYGVSGKFTTPALLRTCKQIRSEAAKIYFTNNKFAIAITTDTLDNLYGSLKAIGPKHAGLIRGFTLVLDVEQELAEAKGPTRGYAHTKSGKYVAPWKTMPKRVLAYGIRGEVKFDLEPADYFEIDLSDDDSELEWPDEAAEDYIEVLELIVTRANLELHYP